MISEMTIEILQNAVDTYGVILALMLADLVTGIMNSFVHKTALSSKRLKSSLTKAISYFLLILIASVCRNFGTEFVHSILVMYLVCVESLSILENVQDIFPRNKVLKLFSDKLKILKNKNEKKLKEDDE